MATTYDKASLVMIPSGVKESKLYSIKPTSGDGDFTFSRGTDTATRVNSSGLIEKERSNQLLQSNQFDTTWLSNNVTETSGQSGYDGSSDAWLLSKASASGNLQQIRTLSDVQTLSIYAKAGTLSWIRFLMTRSAGNSPSAFFNLSGSGSVGTTSGVGFIDASIESVGGDWYRCSLVVNIDLVNFRIYPADGDDDVSGTSGNIYIQDAQLEQGLVATAPAIETTTTAVYEGITDNLPRLDYSGGASCPSLLLEGSRTNAISQSEYFSAWDTINPTLTQNYGISPDGTQNSTRCVFADANDALEYLVSSSAATATIYIKGTNGETIQFGTNGAEEIFTFNGEWQRLEKYNAGSIARVTLNTYGGATARDFEIWGAQLEAGSYPTSYIPTYGTSASRVFDDCEITSASDLFGASQGSIYVEGTAILDSNGSMPFTAGSGSANLIYAWFRTNGSINFDFYQGGSLQASITTAVGTISNGDSFKLAVGYQDNDFVAYLNGTQLGTDTSGTAPNPDSFILGGYIAPDYYGSGIKQSLLFKTRLTNAELAALTTI